MVILSGARVNKLNIGFSATTRVILIVFRVVLHGASSLELASGAACSVKLGAISSSRRGRV